MQAGAAVRSFPAELGRLLPNEFGLPRKSEGNSVSGIRRVEVSQWATPHAAGNAPRRSGEVRHGGSALLMRATRPAAPQRSIGTSCQSISQGRFPTEYGCSTVSFWMYKSCKLSARMCWAKASCSEARASADFFSHNVKSISAFLSPSLYVDAIARSKSTQPCLIHCSICSIFVRPSVAFLSSLSTNVP
jgi:hypothetical protein